MLQGEDDAARLAQYLEGRGQPEMAADAWVNAPQAERAISLYVQVRASTLADAWQRAYMLPMGSAMRVRRW
jgi:hypothetical protein